MHLNLARAMALALVAGGLVACGPATPTYSFTYAEKRGRLENNGLRFAVVPMKDSEVVEVDVRWQVGANEDPPGKAGLAHLVEHLMFQQKPDGENTPPLMHYLGQLSTFFNAYTNWDTTHYQTQGRADQLDALLKIEAMRMFYRCQTITEDQFEREREVVRNEIRQRGGTPDGQIPQIVLSAAYPKGHAYEQMVGGDDSQLSSITLQDACTFMDSYYTPDRATIVVAGGVDPDEVAKGVEKWFGKVPRREPAPRKAVEPVVLKPHTETHELDVERSSIWMAWAMPRGYSDDGNNFTPDGQAASIATNALLYKLNGANDDYEFATGMGGFALGGKLAPVFVLVVELRDESHYGEAMDFMKHAADQAYRLFEGNFENLKIQAKADFIAGHESVFDRTGDLADRIQFDDSVDWSSDKEYLIKALDDIDQLDVDRTRDMAKRLLDPGKAVVVHIKAKQGGMGGDKRSNLKFEVKTHDRKEEPEVDPREAKRPLTVAAELKTLDGAQRFTLGNGMRVVLMPRSGMPIVAAQLIFDVGAAHEPTPGVADAAASFLSTPIDADAFQKVGVRTGRYTTRDHSVFMARGIDLYTDVMIKGMERWIIAGEYFQESLEKWQKAERDSYSQKSTQEQLEFERQLNSALFGADHPYTRTSTPSLSSINQIGRDVLTDFKRTHYSAKNATFILVGSFDPKHAESVIRETFGGWGGGHQDKPIAPTPAPRSHPEFIGVTTHLELPQMTVTIAYPSPAGIDGQEAARLVLANMVNERMGDLRFKLGATYGVYARRTDNVGPSYYQMGGSVDATRAGEALKAMRDGVDQLRKGGEQFDIDFVRARRRVIQTLLSESSVTQELAAKLGTIARFGLPADYYNTTLQQAAAVSPAQIKALIESELQPAAEIVICRGYRPVLEKAFAEAGLNSVKIVDPEYK